MNSRNEAEDYEDDDAPESGSGLVSLRGKVRGVSGACLIVEQSLLKWTASKGAPEPDESGESVVELCYRKVERPLKSFRFAPDSEDETLDPEVFIDARQLAESIVYTAGQDVLSSETDESFAVRLYGGNESRSFRLTLVEMEEFEDEDAKPKRHLAMTAPRPVEEPTGMDAIFRQGGDIGASAFQLQLQHNIEMAKQLTEVTGIMINSRKFEAESAQKRIKELEERVNSMVTMQWETLTQRDEIYSRKAEIDAGIRAEEREAESKAARDAKLEEYFKKYAVPIMAAKFGLGGMLAQMGMMGGEGGAGGGEPAPDGSGAPPAGIMDLLHNFFSTISNEQKNTLLVDKTIKLDEEQIVNLFAMLQALQAQHEASSGGQAAASQENPHG